MENYEKLTKAGIDMKALLGRLMGNAALIKLFLTKFVADTNFETLVKAFDEKDMKKAEIASHTLKGMCGNMSLTVLFALFTEQVNFIRKGDYEKAEAMMEEISVKYQLAISNMKEWMSEN